MVNMVKKNYRLSSGVPSGDCRYDRTDSVGNVVGDRSSVFTSGYNR